MVLLRVFVWWYFTIRLFVLTLRNKKDCTKEERKQNWMALGTFVLTVILVAFRQEDVGFDLIFTSYLFAMVGKFLFEIWQERTFLGAFALGRMTGAALSLSWDWLIDSFF